MSSLIFISSCTVSIEDYSKSNKTFDIREYFDGQVSAWGIVQDRSGKVIRKFCVEIEGKWEENSGVLAEKFYFDDGEVSYRNWQLSKTLEGDYLGTAEDVVGLARGKHNGFAFNMIYQLDVAVEGENYHMTMDDWMFQIDDNKVINKTTMSKYGVKFADITLSFDKANQPTQCDVT